MLGRCVVCWFRYGVEPPVLVKLEKEIELEESLLMTVTDHASPVKTFTVCCQHGALYHAVSITHTHTHTCQAFSLS